MRNIKKLQVFWNNRHNDMENSTPARIPGVLIDFLMFLLNHIKFARPQILVHSFFVQTTVATY